jgi:hypothetical protein
LNRRAHNLKTEGLIELRQPGPGVFEWTTRTGHTYTRLPDPVPIAGWNLPPAAELPADPGAEEFAEMLAALEAA